MRLTPSFVLLLAAAAASCSLYNDALIQAAEGDGDSLDSAGGSGGYVPFNSGGTGSTTGGTGGVVTGGTGTGSTPGVGGMGGDMPGVGGGEGIGSCDVDPTETVSLVDDMRLAANRILPMDGRKGDWLAFHGSDMMIDPVANASGSWPSTPMTLIPGTSDDYALHYMATKIGSDNAEIWQQFGFLLNDGEAYDLSSYAGILFCGLRVASTPQSLSLRVTTYAPDMADEEQFETPGGIVPTSWGIVKIPFGDIPTAALENAKNIEFIGGNGVEYDIWIDNVALYE